MTDIKKEKIVLVYINEGIPFIPFKTKENYKGSIANSYEWLIRKHFNAPNNRWGETRNLLSNATNNDLQIFDEITKESLYIELFLKIVYSN